MRERIKEDKKISKRNFSLLSKKSGQDHKSKIYSPVPSKKAQEEMVGFGLIIIFVAVILLVFVGTTLKKSAREEIESYEVSAFTGSILQQTTSCQKNMFYLDIENLIFECANGAKCNNLDSCVILNNTLKGILQVSWIVGEEGGGITGGIVSVKGYELVIVSGSKKLTDFREGNINTKNYKSNPPLDRAKGATQFTFYFTAYY